MSSLLALTTGAGAGTGFRRDARFAFAAPTGAAMGTAMADMADLPEPEPEPEPDAPDPIALAWAEGFEKGLEHARAEADGAAAQETAARAVLELSLSRLDASLREDLRQRLQDTVMALCEATLVPYALDPDALAGRVERALAMFNRAEDERIIRLHPEDIALLSERMRGEWTVVPDSALARGALRVETATGGVEDGPAEWRRALAEAFHAC